MNTYVDKDVSASHTIVVANSRKTKTRSALETGEVFRVGDKFYVYSEFSSHCIGVCLNAPQILTYHAIPAVVELFRVTDVEQV